MNINMNMVLLHNYYVVVPYWYSLWLLWLW